MDELERMLRGEEYFGSDEKLMKMKADARRFCELYNSSEEDQARRAELQYFAFAFHGVSFLSSDATIMSFTGFAYAAPEVTVGGASFATRRSASSRHKEKTPKGTYLSECRHLSNQ